MVLPEVSETGLVGQIQTLGFLRDHRKGVRPCDRLIMRRVRVPYHRRSETPLLIQPDRIGIRRQLGIEY